MKWKLKNNRHNRPLTHSPGRDGTGASLLAAHGRRSLIVGSDEMQKHREQHSCPLSLSLSLIHPAAAAPAPHPLA